MIKIFDLPLRARDEGGETVLGRADLGTHACYLIFGYLEPGRPPRVLSPGHGHEEIICVVQGQARLQGDGEEQALGPGQAFHLVGEITYTLENSGSETVVYLAAGGHSPGHQHQHA